MAKPRLVHEPGEPALNNAGDESPDDIAASREATTAANAAADLLKSGDVAGATALLQQATTAAQADEAPRETLRRTADGTLVSISPPRTPGGIDAKYGRETGYPDGTALDANLQPCAAGTEPVYIVGRVLTPMGWLISRAIPLADLPPAA